MFHAINQLHLLTILIALLSSAPLRAQQDVQVSQQDGLLSVQASNASVSRLAEVLSDELGINVVITGNTEELVNIDIVNEPLEKALTKLSPNNMLVKSGENENSDVIEVVLMMSDGAPAGPSAGSEEFLPSGSPADEVFITEQGNSQADDGAPLRDPNRSEQARDAANAATNDAAGQPVDVPGQNPSVEAFDPVTGLPIDPLTGQPLQSQ